MNKPKLQKGTLTLKAKKQLNSRVWELTFKADQDLDFKPGQFFMLEIPHEDGIVKRAYSAASLPGTKALKLMIKYEPQGIASEHFKHMKVGEKLPFSGPYGALTLPKDYPGPVIFAVTGTGLAPVWSILENLKKQNRSNPVHLLMGVTTEEDAFYLEEFEKMTKAYPFTYTLCVEKPPQNYLGACGYVTDHFTSPPLTFDPMSAEIFIVGNPMMVQATQEYLKKHGFAPTQIHVEKFS